MWERIDSLIIAPDRKSLAWPDTYSQRMQVPGGWLVRTVSRGHSYSGVAISAHTVFIFDPKHEWIVTLEDPTI